MEINKIEYKEMMRYIGCGEAVCIYESNKKNSNDHNRSLIKLHDEYYLLCNLCDCFYQISFYNNHKRNKNFMFKEDICIGCKNKKHHIKYTSDFNYNMNKRYNYLSIRSKENNVECLSYKEFLLFAESYRDPIYNLTLKEAFEKEMYDKVDVEHKVAISKGGSSLVDNLILIPTELNLMKLDNPIEDTVSMIELLYKNIKNIKQAYGIEEVEI